MWIYALPYHWNTFLLLLLICLCFAVIVSDRHSAQVKHELESLVDHVFNVDMNQASEGDELFEVANYMDASDSEEDLKSLETSSMLKLNEVIAHFIQSAQHDKFNCSMGMRQPLSLV